MREEGERARKGEDVNQEQDRDGLGAVGGEGTGALVTWHV